MNRTRYKFKKVIEKGWKDNILRAEKNNIRSSHTDMKNDLFSIRAI